MTTTLELVRHAKAAARDRWWGRPDRERPLTESGHEQARALARQLGNDGDIDALYSSAFTRCVQTLEPLAEALGLEVISEDALAEAAALPVLDGGDAWVASAWLGGRALAFVNRVAADYPDGRVVACSHGDVVPALMATIVGRDGLDLRNVRCSKGGRFTLELDGPHCLRVVAVPAPDV